METQIYGESDGPLYGVIKTTQRDHIINEIYDTERKYVLQLENIETHFMVPLRKILPKTDIDIIFINLEELTKMHRKFFENLEKVAEEKYERRLISVPFKSFQDKISNYAEYLLGIDESQV